MVHTSKPRAAKVFITEYSPRPGTVTSKLLREEMEEPCTRNSTGRAGVSPALGGLERLRNRLSETSPFLAMYSLLQILAEALVGAANSRGAAAARAAPATILRREILSWSMVHLSGAL